MTEKQSTKPCKHPRPTKGVDGRKKSFIVVASATRALKRLTPSSKTLEALLSSATLMHPEALLASIPETHSSRDKADNAGNQTLHQQSLDARMKNSLPLEEGFSNNHIGEIYNTELHSQPTISLYQGRISSKTESDYDRRFSLEQRRTESPSSTQRSSVSSRSAVTYDNIRFANEILQQTFSDDPVHIHGSQMVNRHDIGPMIELHELVWCQDRLLQRLQRTQVSSAEAQVMMKLLGDRITSTLDNVLVARINKSHHPMDIVGWLSCSIVRSKIKNKHMTVDNEIRAMPWNLATAAVLNASHNAGSITCLRGDPNLLRERNYLLEVLCKGSKWYQRDEIGDQDFINITNLVIHPNYPHGRDIAKRLVLEACHQASLLRMPLFVASTGDYCAQLYKEECGFQELGEHISLLFDPVYKIKYLVVRPLAQEPGIRKEGRGSGRFDFGWRSLRGS